MGAQQWWNASSVLAIIAICAGIIIGWANLKRDSRWHTEWIEEHEKKCRDELKDLRLREEQFASVKKDTAWHAEWIQEHDRNDRDQHKEMYQRTDELVKLIDEVRIVNTRIVAVAEHNMEILRRHEQEIERIREKIHDLADTINFRINKPSSS